MVAAEDMPTSILRPFDSTIVRSVCMDGAGGDLHPLLYAGLQHWRYLVAISDGRFILAQRFPIKPALTSITMGTQEACCYRDP